MALPATIRVKISDEAGGSVSFSPVVTKELAVRDLVEVLVIASGGKSAARIAELLSHGSLVSGASRFRWESFPAAPAALETILGTFPDPDPDRIFQPAQCRGIVLRAKASSLPLPLEAVSRKRWLRKRSFADTLMELAAAGPLRYGGYSYRDRADCFLLAARPETAEVIARAIPLLASAALRNRIASFPVESIEFHAAR
jgi:hypothetical protein